MKLVHAARIKRQVVSSSAGKEVTSTVKSKDTSSQTSGTVGGSSGRTSGSTKGSSSASSAGSSEHTSAKGSSSASSAGSSEHTSAKGSSSARSAGSSKHTSAKGSSSASSTGSSKHTSAKGISSASSAGSSKHTSAKGSSSASSAGSSEHTSAKSSSSASSAGSSEHTSAKGSSSASSAGSSELSSTVTTHGPPKAEEWVWDPNGLHVAVQDFHWGLKQPEPNLPYVFARFHGSQSASPAEWKDGSWFTGDSKEKCQVVCQRKKRVFSTEAPKPDTLKPTAPGPDTLKPTPPEPVIPTLQTLTPSKDHRTTTSMHYKELPLAQNQDKIKDQGVPVGGIIIAVLAGVALITLIAFIVVRTRKKSTTDEGAMESAQPASTAVVSGTGDTKLAPVDAQQSAPQDTLQSAPPAGEESEKESKSASGSKSEDSGSGSPSTE